MDSRLERKQKQGQDLYRQKKYKEALEVFNAVVEEYVDPPITVLDNRAATLLKLDDLKNALKDGRKMITLGKTEVSGYLRTGQILQKMGKDETALGIYKYGLRNVATSNPDAKLLRGMYDKLVKRCSPPKAMDPLLMLPIELVQMVIEYLPFSNIVCLLRVSKQWKDLLKAMPGLWRELDLSNARKAVRVSAVKNYAKYSNKLLNRAILYRADTANGEALEFLIGHCPKLEHLELLDGISNSFLVRAAPFARYLTTLVLGEAREISLDAVTEILGGCEGLIRAEFHSVVANVEAVWKHDLKSLRKLRLNGSQKPRLKDLSLLALDELFSKMPDILDLTILYWNLPEGMGIPDFSLLQSLSSLDYEGFLPNHTPILPETLQSLRVSRSFGLGISGLKNLTTLIIPFSNQILPSDLYVLLEPGKGNLRTLAINHSTQFDMQGLIHDLCFQGFLPRIEDLVLKESALDDRALKWLADHCPRLTSLNVSHNESITGVGIKALVLKEGDKIANINLTHCRGVSPDAVQWARQQGVHIIYKFPDYGRNQGRRVRYG